MDCSERSGPLWPRPFGAGRKGSDTMNAYWKFGLLLRQARDARKLQPADVAREAGMSGSFLERVERGVALPSLMLLAVLWRLLGFDANELLDTLGIRSREIPRRLLGARRLVGLQARMIRGRFMEAGLLIARTRYSAGLTQNALGAALGVSGRFVTCIEAGMKLPSVVLAAKLRHALGIDGNKLLEAALDEPPRAPFHEFGRVLRLAREKRGMQPGDVARLARCELLAYERAESGDALPTVRELARMHRVLRFNGNAALRVVWMEDSQGKGVA